MVELREVEIVTEPFRLAFPALFEPKPVAQGEEKTSYQATLLLPPDANLKPFLRCIAAAMRDEWGKVEKITAGRSGWSPHAQPIKPCDGRYAGFDEGWHFIRTSSQYQPSVVDQRKQEILDPNRIFAGCWCRFHLNTYAWKHPVGGKGVSFSLNAVQLVREDERLDGRKSAQAVFDEIEVEGVEDLGVDTDELDELLS